MNEKDDFVLEAILKATPYHDKDSKILQRWSKRRASAYQITILLVADHAGGCTLRALTSLNLYSSGRMIASY